MAYLHGKMVRLRLKTPPQKNEKKSISVCFLILTLTSGYLPALHIILQLQQTPFVFITGP